MDKQELQKRYNEHKEEKYHKLSQGKYLGDMVYGANDGIITSFVVVTGAVGASLSPGVIIILGLANLLADGFSMGASSFLSMRSDKDFQKAQRKKEEYEVRHMPEVEKEEVREILKKWGVSGECRERATQEITQDKKRWVDLMMREELNIIEEDADYPARHGAMTMFAFVTIGSVPLLPYFFPVADETRFLFSLLLTGIILFLVGAARYIVSRTVSWLKQGMEMLVVGGLAALVAYMVGYILRAIFGVIV